MSISRHTTYNLIGAVVPMAASLVTIPIYLRLIGEARYGVLAIAWLLLGYFGLLDLGLGRATAQRIAAQRHATSGERAQTFWTAVSVNMAIGLVGGLLMWPVASYFFGNVFKVEDALRPEVRAAVPWLILAVPMATLSGVLEGALQGREKFLELNLVSVSGALLFQTLPLAVAAIFGAHLGTLLPTAILARLITLVALFSRCHHHISGSHPAAPARAEAGHLLRFGGWVTVSSFVGPMMVVFDRFIIGALTGAKAVAHYSVPFQLSERSTVLSNALSSALFPRLAAAAPAEQARLACDALRALKVAVTPLTVAGMLLMRPFLSWWISVDFAEHAALVGQIVLLGFWANSFAKIPYAQLQARGRPDLVATCHVGELLPYLGLLYFGMKAAGLAGAAAAFSVRVLLDLLMLAMFAGLLRHVLQSLLVPGLLMTTAFLVATQVTSNGWRPAALAGICLSATVFWAWRESPPDLRGRALIRLAIRTM